MIEELKQSSPKGRSTAKKDDGRNSVVESEDTNFRPSEAQDYKHQKSIDDHVKDTKNIAKDTINLLNDIMEEHQTAQQQAQVIE